MLKALCLPSLALEASELPLLTVTAGKRVFTFRTEYKRAGTPQQIELALIQVRKSAREAGVLPLVVVPYLSEERPVSREQGNKYRLYRLFSFAIDPRLFIVPGPLDTALILEPYTYRAYLRP